MGLIRNVLLASQQYELRSMGRSKTGHETAVTAYWSWYEGRVFEEYTTVQARLEPAPPLPTLGPKPAARESVFVLAGYGSPSKLARAQLIVQRCGTPAPVLIFRGEQLHATPLVPCACSGAHDASLPTAFSCAHAPTAAPMVVCAHP